MCIFFVKPYVYWATGEWQAWTEEERESRGLAGGGSGAHCIRAEHTASIYIPWVATHQRLRGQA